MKVTNTNSKYLIKPTKWKPPQQKKKKNLCSQSGNHNKLIYVAGDLNLNVRNYNNNDKVKKSENATFEYELFLGISKATRMTKYSATVKCGYRYNKITFLTIFLYSLSLKCQQV